MLVDLHDDAIHNIGVATAQIQCVGPISIVMFSRVCRRLYFLLKSIAKDAKQQWTDGFSARYTGE